MFLMDLGADDLLRRCMMCAERKIHLPVMSWVDDNNARIHLMALHILSKLTDYVTHENSEWCHDVCKALFSFGALPKIIEKCRKDMPQMQTAQFAANILHNMAHVTEAASRLITKSEALQEAVEIVCTEGSSQTHEALPVACAKMLAVLSMSEENRSDMAYTNKFVTSLEKSLNAQIEQASRESIHPESPSVCCSDPSSVSVNPR